MSSIKTIRIIIYNFKLLLFSVLCPYNKKLAFENDNNYFSVEL